MKQNWQPEESVKHWTLISPELDLLTKKTAINRLEPIYKVNLKDIHSGGLG